MTNRRARKKLNKLRLHMIQSEVSDNDYCFELIKKFKEFYGKCKPDKKYTGMFKHYSYWLRLLPIRKAFEKNDYVLVLHELNTIIVLDEIYQLRVRTALIDLLNKYVQ